MPLSAPGALLLPEEAQVTYIQSRAGRQGRRMFISPGVLLTRRDETNP